jgi:hypothetical protein
MKQWIVVVVALACAGCLGANTYIPVIERVLELAAKVAAEHGAKLEDVPMTCEHEYDPRTQKLLILCEANLSHAHRSPQ